MQLNFKNLFPELPDHSRVWLYLANRKLDSTELHYAEEQLQSFLKSWAAHGKNLFCDGRFLFDQYLILVVDEKQESASGCSIDSSVRFVKSLGNELGVDFFNRLNVLTFVSENKTKSSNYFQAMKGTIPYLNPLIETLGELRENWLLTPVIK
jgi:hypothetical protein